MLSTQLQEANKAIKGEAVTTKQSLMTVGTEMASFAATGAAIGGPIGAAAGALVGMGVGIFKNIKATEEYNKVLAANELQQKRTSQISQAKTDNFQGRSSETVMSQLKKVGEAGFGGLDMSTTLQKLENQLTALAVEAPSEDRSEEKIKEDFEKVSGRHSPLEQQRQVK